MRKRSQSISINTIIVAAIALLVLVIVSVIFMRSIGDWMKKRTDCRNFQANGCDFGKNCPSGYIINPDKYCYTGDDRDPSAVCCVPVNS
jgi:hypothetical protein